MPCHRTAIHGDVMKGTAGLIRLAWPCIIAARVEARLEIRRPSWGPLWDQGWKGVLEKSRLHRRKNFNGDIKPRSEGWTAGL